MKEPPNPYEPPSRQVKKASPFRSRPGRELLVTSIDDLDFPLCLRFQGWRGVRDPGPCTEPLLRITPARGERDGLGNLRFHVLEAHSYPHTGLLMTHDLEDPLSPGSGEGQSRRKPKTAWLGDVGEGAGSRVQSNGTVAGPREAVCSTDCIRTARHQNPCHPGLARGEHSGYNPLRSTDKPSGSTRVLVADSGGGL